MSLFSSKFLNEMGVSDWGYTTQSVPRSWEKFKSWIHNKGEGDLLYLSDHRKNLRADIKNFFPEFQSALVFLFDYTGVKKSLKDYEMNQKIAAYSMAFDGDDYHFVIKNRLEKIALELKKNFKFKWVISLDIHPVMERDLAYRAGLGWFGKNSMLIHPKKGSYFLIGSLLLSIQLPVDAPLVVTDHCGSCRACVDACPTEAIDGNSRTLKANLCLSTFTIEKRKDEPPPMGREKSPQEIFGCDICQDVCPWNRKPLFKAQKQKFSEKGMENIRFWLLRSPSEIYLEISKMSGRAYQRLFKGSVFTRPGKKGILKNLKSLINK